MHPVEDLAYLHHADPHYTFAQITELPLDGEIVLLEVAPFRRWHMVFYPS